ncbi:uncharacterized protein LOC135686392 [Rhopilema esculentum]|uniref:uncharacterized protein LOC135686392 n=1 Tax=Rhopilema esculentum TaxID=499914 RepID=UPI0031E2D979
MPDTGHIEQIGKETPSRPPWGLQTPKSKIEDRRNAGYMSTYDRMFQGWKGSPAKPIRQSTAPHLNEGMWVDRTSYRETFRTPHSYSRYNIIPASVNRHHKPHPSRLVWPLEPNKSYMIWKPDADLIPARKVGTAPPSLTQFSKQRWMNTTYSDFFQGQQQLDSFGNVVRTAEAGGRRPTTDYVGSRTGSRPTTMDAGHHLNKTIYRHDFKGEFGRPSTIDKPPDRSWANIPY